MIPQRFYPISTPLGHILGQCFYNEEDPYIAEQYNLDILDVDDTILSSEKRLISILEKLAEFTDESKAIKYIQTMESEDQFLLYVAIKISFLHFNAATEKLPLIPPVSIYPTMYAYLQEGYYSFKEHCQKNNLSIWSEILDYEIDSMHTPFS